jgi:hypothetical protein
MLIPVFRDKYHKAFPTYPNAQRIHYVEHTEALSRAYRSDAHFAAYSYPDVPHRLSYDVLNGKHNPAMVLAVFDVDDREKHEGVARESWMTAERGKIDRLIGDYPGLFVYQTTGGYRVVGALEKPLEIESRSYADQWTALYISWCNFLERCYEIKADHVKDWTRLFRLPRVLRDGKPTDGFLLGDPANLGIWQPELIADDSPTIEQRKHHVRNARIPGEFIVYKLCEEDDLIIGPHKRGGWSIRCPLEQEHSEQNTSDTDTVMWPPEEGRPWGNIQCLHTGCSHDQHKTPHDWFKTVPGWQERFKHHKRSLNNVTPLPGVEQPDEDDPRAPIELGLEQERSLPVVVSKVIDRLAANDNGIYQRDAQLVRIVEGTRHYIAEHSEHSIANAIDRIATVIKVTAGKRKVESEGGKVEYLDYEKREKLVSAPHVIAKRVLVISDYPRVRPIRGIVRYPFLTPSWGIVTEAGYNAESRVWAPHATPVKLRPDAKLEDAQESIAALRDLMSDFPWETTDDFAAWLSLPLSILARPAFTDPVPGHLATATVSRAGKGLSLDIATTIALGETVPKSQLSKDDDEQSKQIFGYIAPGDPCVIIDNVKGKLGGPAIEALHTSSVVRLRILGKSESRDLPNHSVWAYSANQAEVTTDMVGRLVNWRLVPAEESPGERETFRHHDILAHVRGNRITYLGHLLTILHAYRNAGFPQQRLSPAMGGFETWGRYVRAPLVWSGAGDPVGTQRRLREQGDTEIDAVREQVATIGRIFGVGEFTSADLAQSVADRSTQGREHFIRFGRDPDARSVSQILGKLKDRKVSGRVLRSAKDRTKTNCWRLEYQSDAGSAGS